MDGLRGPDGLVGAPGPKGERGLCLIYHNSLKDKKERVFIPLLNRLQRRAWFDWFGGPERRQRRTRPVWIDWLKWT